MKRLVMLFVWTLFCSTVTSFIIAANLGRTVHIGTDIVLTTSEGNQLAINAESATIEADSGEFFYLTQPVSGDKITGLPAIKPFLGYKRPLYFKADSAIREGGVWIVEDGSDVTIHITGPTDITVQEDIVPSRRNAVNIAWTIMGALIWFMFLKAGTSK